MTSQINDEPESPQKTIQGCVSAPQQITANTPNPLIIEEYREKRNYLRHIEDHDLKVLQWYFVVVAGSLAFLYNKLDSLFLIELPQKEGSILLLTFLVLYSIFISLHLFFRKENYTLFVNRLFDLEEAYCGLTKQSPSRTVFKVYRFRLIFVNLLGAGCFCLLAYAMTLTGLWPVLYFSVYLVVFTAVLWGTTRHKGNG